LSFAEATGILRAVVASGRCIVGCDLTEVSPPLPAPHFDSVTDDWDAKRRGAHLYKMIGFMLNRSRPERFGSGVAENASRLVGVAAVRAA